MKRIRPAPMGRAFRYQRRLAHISVSLAELPVTDEIKVKDKKPAAKTTTKRKKTA